MRIRASVRREGDAVRVQAARRFQSAVERALVVLGEEMREHVRARMAEPKHGRLYLRYRTRRRHVASAPGEYPAIDTGRLVSSVNYRLDGPWALEFGVGSATQVVYARYLEFGTRRMAPRPFLRPTLDAFERRAVELIGAVLRRAAGGE